MRNVNAWLVSSSLAIDIEHVEEARLVQVSMFLVLPFPRQLNASFGLTEFLQLYPLTTNSSTSSWFVHRDIYFSNRL